MLSNDWVVRDDNRFYQVERQSQHHAPAKSKVTVCEGEDGRIEVHYRDRKLSWTEIPGALSAIGKTRRLARRPRRPRRSGDPVPTIPGAVAMLRGRRRWPRPPLRPKRSALRAPQGFAPTAANAGIKSFQESTKRDKVARKANIKKGTFLSGLDIFNL